MEQLPLRDRLDILRQDLRAWLNRDWRKSGRGLLRAFVCIGVTFLHTYCYATYYGQRAERALLHEWFSIRGARSVPSAVTVVKLDEHAYAKVNRLPYEKFPRWAIAEGLEKMTAAGAKLIVLDLFAKGKGDDLEGNERLASALASSPSVIGRYTETITEVDENGKKQTRKESNKPFQRFADSAKMVIPLMVATREGVAEEVSLANEDQALVDKNVPLLEPLREFVSKAVQSPSDFDFINYYGGPSSLTSLSFGELIGSDREVPQGYFKDRVVFVGLCSDAGVGVSQRKDEFLTSASQLPMFGVEIHATIAANLLDGSWIRRYPPEVEVAVLACVAFLFTFVAISVDQVFGSLLVIGLIGGWLGFSYYSFSQLFRFVPGVTLSLVLIVTLIIGRFTVNGLLSSRIRRMVVGMIRRPEVGLPEEKLTDNSLKK